MRLEADPPTNESRNKQLLRTLSTFHHQRQMCYIMTDDDMYPKELHSTLGTTYACTYFHYNYKFESLTAQAIATLEYKEELIEGILQSRFFSVQRLIMKHLINYNNEILHTVKNVTIHGMKYAVSYV